MFDERRWVAPSQERGSKLEGIERDTAGETLPSHERANRNDKANTAKITVERHPLAGVRIGIKP